MKIKKLSKLNNAFLYSFFDWDTVNPAKGNNPNNPIDVFKKSNILFAENGNGKSKLVNIFKSLNENTNNIEKHRDRGNDTQEIKVVLGGEVETKLLEIRVFEDSTKRSVYEAQTALTVRLDTMQTKTRFGVLRIWTPTTLPHGARVVLLM